MKVWLWTIGLLTVTAEVYFKETFDAGWQKRWVEASAREDGSQGKFKQSAGKWSVDPSKDVGIQTSTDNRFYAISAKFPAATNKDRTLVISYTVKHEQGLDCGGGYLKLLSPDFDQDKFGGDTPFLVMFGPDICGSERKTHLLLPYKGKNYLPKKKFRVETNMLTHEYTAVIRPDNTFAILIDGFEVAGGDLEDFYDFIAPRKIVDQHAKKPDDWVDEPMIADPDEMKPAGWDDVPEFIPDPSAFIPEDWEEGEWVPPLIKNPDFKGEWNPKMIPNPNYKGPWKASKIQNPDYIPDPNLYLIDSFGGIGFEIWQVRSGTIFDNIFIGDSLEEAQEFSKLNFEHRKKGEEEAKAQFEEAEELQYKELRERAETEDDYEQNVRIEL